MLLAVIAAALTTVALDDVLMVLLMAIALMLVGIFVYVVYALALATRSRAYPVTRWRHPDGPPSHPSGRRSRAGYGSNY